MMQRVVFVLFLLFASILTRGDEIPHLELAREIVKTINPNQTSYRHKDQVFKWTGRDAEENECRTDCSGLISNILLVSYHLSRDNLKIWFGKKAPLAREYFKTIEQQRGFERIHQIDEVQPGDIIALKYETGNENTGHVMIVQEKPKPMKDSLNELAVQKWEVRIIDSTGSGHGNKDSRYLGSSKYRDGVGEGSFCLFTSDGKISGYSWSTFSNSKYYEMSQRPLTIGRFHWDHVKRIISGEN